MRRIGSRIAALAAIAAAVLLGVAADAGTPWSIELLCVRGSSTVSATVNADLAASLGTVEMKLDQKGVTRLFRGTPLAAIVGLVDDGDRTTFNRALWTKGYAITVTANDGFSATLDTATVAPEDVMLALSADGGSIAPMIVGQHREGPLGEGHQGDRDRAAGSGSDRHGDRSAARRRCRGKHGAVHPRAAREKPVLRRGRSGASPPRPGRSTPTPTAGSKLVGFLGQFAPVTADTTIVFVASDGYEMSYEGSQILDASDGDWILAFRMDGQYLPNDPGWFRTLKVGPTKPNIDGHLSVRWSRRSS